MEYEAGKNNILEAILLNRQAEPEDLPISLLKTITKDFSPDMQIGNGGFAVVYKGQLQNGLTIAVKKLSNSIDVNENKYVEEVRCLMKVKHKNIVRFLGYCADTQGKMCEYAGKLVMADVRQRLLCFEYLPRGSLELYITDASCGLKWRKRYQIIKGICDGLHYLHASRIVHLDLKPANILLDDSMVPKIADFGLSRCFDENQTRAITSKPAGSIGYLAPEVHGGEVTRKSDIYSLGVIIIEMLTGRKGYPAVEKVLESWRNTLSASSPEFVLEQIRVCTQIGIECIESNPAKRPVVQHIIKMLDEAESADCFVQADMNTTSLTLVSCESNGVNKVCYGKALIGSEVSLPSEVKLDSICTTEVKLEKSMKDEEHRQQALARAPEHLQKLRCILNRSVQPGKLQQKESPLNKGEVKAVEWVNRGDKLQNVKIFTRKEMKIITNNYEKCIGDGSLGKTYKGTLRDNTVVAVRASMMVSIKTLDEFVTEVKIQSNMIHRNILKLYGCCLEVKPPVLVYEYAANGSLQEILHCIHGSPKLLTLNSRLDIAIGSAEGLAYLRSYVKSNIQHGDVKPSNILLDGDLVPKISDFGLSNLLIDDNQYTNYVVGCLDYKDVVLKDTGLLTPKSDVYSFGVVLLELICRKPVSYGGRGLVMEFKRVFEKDKTGRAMFDNDILKEEDILILEEIGILAMTCISDRVPEGLDMASIARRLSALKEIKNTQDNQGSNECELRDSENEGNSF